MIPGVISGVVDLGRDNDARLLRLRTALGLGTGFQLVIVEVEPGPIRKEVIRRIKTWSGQASIGTLAVVSLDPDATLTAQLGGKSGAIVTGLEPPSPMETPARDWIAEFNWSRDALPGLVSGALVLVVSQAMHQGLFERAPDLYSWRRHTARVVITARELAVSLSFSGDRHWLHESARFADIVATDLLNAKGRATMLLQWAEALLSLGDERRASRVLDQVSVLEGLLTADRYNNFLREYCGLLHAECALVRGDFAAARVAVGEIDVLPDHYGLEGILALLRGRIHAAEGAWDVAIDELRRAIEFVEDHPEPHLLARARECLCQIALARGEIAQARHEISDLIQVASEHLSEWGFGMLLRLATVAGDLYPDEIPPLLDAAFTEVESLSNKELMVGIWCLRVKRAWLLERAELAYQGLAQAEHWIRPEDPAETHALLALCRAGVALAAGSTSEGEVAVPLARACELFRSTAPRQSVVAGGLLGEFWKHLGQSGTAPGSR